MVTSRWKIRGSITLAALMVCLACSCAAPPEAVQQPAQHRLEFTHPALGTVFRVVVYCLDEPSVGRAEAIVIRRLAELDETFDAARPSSELSQLHANAGLGAVRVSDEFYSLVRQSMQIAQRSNRAFDITAGVYEQLWQEAIASGTLPSPEQRQRAGELVGRDKLRLDPINRTVHLLHEGSRLHLGDVAIGFACDRVLWALRNAGMHSALVDGGGRIAVGDPPPGQPAWRIEITNADPASRQRLVYLANQGIASSGQINDVVQIGDEHYSRLVDPRHGVGSANLAAVTVVSRHAWLSSALARGAAVLGETDGSALIRSIPNARAWFHHPRLTGAPAPAAPGQIP